MMRVCTGDGTTCMHYARKRWVSCSGCGQTAVQVTATRYWCPRCFLSMTPAPCLCPGAMGMLQHQMMAEAREQERVAQARAMFGHHILPGPAHRAQATYLPQLQPVGPLPAGGSLHAITDGWGLVVGVERAPIMEQAPIVEIMTPPPPPPPGTPPRSRMMPPPPPARGGQGGHGQQGGKGSNAGKGGPSNLGVQVDQHGKGNHGKGNQVYAGSEGSTGGHMGGKGNHDATGANVQWPPL